MDNYRAIRRVLLLTMALNALATLIKLGVGVWSGSLSVLADGLETFFDTVSNVVGLVGITLAFRPPDRDHPYGHRKFESFAALIIAFLLFLTAWEMGKQAWGRLWTPHAPTILPWNMIAIVVSVALQAFTAIYERRRARAFSSEVLMADARHSAANVAVSLAVVGGLALVRAGFPVADPLLALAISLLIVKVGMDILRENLPTLTDRATVPEERIAQVAQEVTGVEHVHAIRSRGPASAASVDLHVHVPRSTVLADAERISDEVRDRLMEQVEGVKDVLVHVEPRALSYVSSGDVFAVIQEVAVDLPLTLHETAAYSVDGRLHVEMDVGVDRDLALGEAHELVSELEARAQERLPQVAGFQTHIELASREITSGQPASPTLRRRVMQLVTDLPDRVAGLLDVHNVTVREGNEGELFLAMDATVDAALTVEEAHRVTQEVEKWLHEQLPGLTRVLVHTEPPGAPLP